MEGQRRRCPTLWPLLPGEMSGAGTAIKNPHKVSKALDDSRLPGFLHSFDKRLQKAKCNVGLSSHLEKVSVGSETTSTMQWVPPLINYFVIKWNNNKKEPWGTNEAKTTKGR